MSDKTIPYGYRLAGLPKEDAICALGSPKAIRELSNIGVDINLGIFEHEKGTYIKLRATREAFLACEAIQAPVYVGTEYKNIRAKIMAPDTNKMTKWRASCPPLSRPLLTHQDDFCAFAFSRRGSFNASEQGTGKTATAVVLSAAWNSIRTLVVCPKSIMPQWEDEYYKVLKSPPPVIILEDLSVAERIRMLSEWSDVTDRHVVVINYEVLDAMLTTLIEKWRPDTVIYDESWRLKNIKTKVTQAAATIADNASHVLLLTGTPIAQDVGDLWSQVRILSDYRGRDMETYAEWLQKYAKMIEIDTGHGFRTPKIIGCLDPVGVVRRLSSIYYRASKAMCTDLPEKLPPTKQKFKLPKNVQTLYNAVERHGESALSPLSLSGGGVTCLRLQQITGGHVPAIHAIDENNSIYDAWADVPVPKEVEGRYQWGESLESPKVDWCVNFARDILLNDKNIRCIIWCKFKNEVGRLVEMLSPMFSPGSVVGVTGSGQHGKNNSQLDTIKNSFNSREDDGVRVIVATIAKLAYGHNLQACDYNIIYSHSWSFLERDQLEDRSHRYGRVGPVSYIELVCTGTIDEEILTATRNRQKLEDRLAPDTTRGKENVI